LRLGESRRLFGDLHYISLAAQGEHRDSHLLAERFQLVNRRRTVHVARHQQRLAPLLGQQFCQFPRGGRLAAPMQP
jgi:hypothetical protein